MFFLKKNVLLEKTTINHKTTRKRKIFMKCFAIKIQPDVRKKKTNRYTEYPSPNEYAHIGLLNTDQDGFHECVNFRNCEGKIKGYIPPHGAKLPEEEPFVFVYITSKANEKEAILCGMYDRIIGVQVGCRLVKETKRKDVPAKLQKYIEEKRFGPLCFKYEALYKNSILFKNTIENASEIIFPKEEHKDKSWCSRPVREIKDHLLDVIDVIDANIHQSQRSQWECIKKQISIPQNKKKRFAASKTPFDMLSGETLVQEADKHYEGKQLTVLVNRYERDSTTKCDMIDAYCSEIDPKNGYKCQVCGFDFEDTYGDLGRNFIEAHHLTPLSEIKENHEVNPATDMIPLCANCHAMIHKMKNPNYEELRDLYQKRCYEKKRLNAARKASKVISAKNFDYIPFHLKNLYELFKKEQNIHNRSRIAQEAHKFMRYLSKDAVKEKWMKEILKEFS